VPSRRLEICRRAATWTSRKADPELAAGPGRDVGPSHFGTGNRWTASRALKAFQIRRSARAVYVSGPLAVRL
jgi:hypothetical protein